MNIRPISFNARLRYSPMFYLSQTAREMFWMNLQVSYDLLVAEQKVGGLIKKQVNPRDDPPEFLEGWDADYSAAVPSAGSEIKWRRRTGKV